MIDILMNILWNSWLITHQFLLWQTLSCSFCRSLFLNNYLRFGENPPSSCEQRWDSGRAQELVAFSSLWLYCLQQKPNVLREPRLLRTCRNQWFPSLKEKKKKPPNKHTKGTQNNKRELYNLSHGGQNRKFLSVLTPPTQGIVIMDPPTHHST